MTKKDAPFRKAQPSTRSIRVDFTPDSSASESKPLLRHLEEDGEYLVEKDIPEKAVEESFASAIIDADKIVAGCVTPSKIETFTSSSPHPRSEVSSDAGDLFVKTLAMSPQDRERFLKMVLNNSFLRKQIDEMIEAEKSAVVVEEIQLEDEDYSDRDVVVSEEPREIKEEKPKSFGEWGT